MKKKCLLLAGVVLLGLLSAGCGKKKQEPVPAAEVTATPTPTPAETAQNTNLVEMQQITQEAEKNVIGSKTATADKLMIYNKTGSDVASIYVRQTPEDSDDDWGADLVQGEFTLKTGDRATYYHENGSASQLFDIRISYTAEGKNECFFRRLPLNDITQISLCMDGVGEDSIPYARYVSKTNKRETSTLDEVKRRLGILDDEDDDDDDDDEEITPTPTLTPEPDEETYANDDVENQPDDPADEAENYIGKSLDDLIAELGEPNGVSYEDEPETGETGYHYYDTFTVSTTVDDDGNEVVAGIW